MMADSGIEVVERPAGSVALHTADILRIIIGQLSLHVSPVSFAIYLTKAAWVLLCCVRHLISSCRQLSR